MLGDGLNRRLGGKADEADSDSSDDLHHRELHLAVGATSVADHET